MELKIVKANLVDKMSRRKSKTHGRDVEQKDDTSHFTDPANGACAKGSATTGGQEGLKGPLRIPLFLTI